MSAAAFYLLKLLQQDKIEGSPLVRKASLAVSDAGYGIYFIHVIVLELLNKGYLGFQPMDFIDHPMIAIPVTCLLTFLLSFLIIAPIRKIPYLRNLIS